MKKIILFVIMMFLCTLCYSQESYPTKQVPVKTNYFLHTGFQFDAVLKTSIFSFNTITPVVAETEYDTMFQGKIMIPRGTKFIGMCAVEKSIDRVNVLFNTMVFPNGQEIKFSGIALHTDGSGGIPGKVKKQKAKLPAQVLLSAAATGSTVAMGGNEMGAEMIKGIAGETKQEIANKQDYSIGVQKNIALQIFVTARIEY